MFLAPVLIGAVVIPPAEAGEWPLFRGDAQLTGVAKETLPAVLEPLWTTRAGSGIESSAVVSDGTVYIGSLDGDLYALDLGSGTEKWRYRAADEIKSSPSVFDGLVYFGDESGAFHAVDATTGVKKWVFEAGAGIVSSANFADGHVLFGSYDNHLYSLVASDGSLAWRLETEGYVHATPAVLERSGEAAVVSAGCDGILRIVGVRSGEQIGQVALGGYVASSPAILGTRAYLGTFENQVLAVDLAAGKILWTYEPTDRSFPFYSSAAIRSDVVVVGGRDKRVHALHPQTGESLWTFPAGSRVDASPVIAGDRAYVGTLGGAIYALDLSSGRPVWQFETGSGIVASPSIVSGRLLIGTSDGTLYCFGAKP